MNILQLQGVGYFAANYDSQAGFDGEARVGFDIEELGVIMVEQIVDGQVAADPVIVSIGREKVDQAITGARYWQGTVAICRHRHVFRAGGDQREATADGQRFIAEQAKSHGRAGAIRRHGREIQTVDQILAVDRRPGEGNKPQAPVGNGACSKNTHHARGRAGARRDRSEALRRRAAGDRDGTSVRRAPT